MKALVFLALLVMSTECAFAQYEHLRKDTLYKRIFKLFAEKEKKDSDEYDTDESIVFYDKRQRPFLNVTIIPSMIIGDKKKQGFPHTHLFYYYQALYYNRTGLLKTVLFYMPGMEEGAIGKAMAIRYDLRYDSLKRLTEVVSSILKDNAGEKVLKWFAIRNVSQIVKVNPDTLFKSYWASRDSSIHEYRKDKPDLHLRHTTYDIEKRSLQSQVTYLYNEFGQLVELLIYNEPYTDQYFRYQFSYKNDNDLLPEKLTYVHKVWYFAIGNWINDTQSEVSKCYINRESNGIKLTVVRKGHYQDRTWDLKFKEVSNAPGSYYNKKLGVPFKPFDYFFWKFVFERSYEDTPGLFLPFE